MADYEREELGINPFTAPSVAEIFQQLDDLKPLPFEQLKRRITPGHACPPAERGMVFGGLVADGFLIVECQKKNLVDDLGRVLLRQARSTRRRRSRHASQRQPYRTRQAR